MNKLILVVVMILLIGNVVVVGDPKNKEGGVYKIDPEDIPPERKNNEKAENGTQLNGETVNNICNGDGKYEGYECKSGAGVINNNNNYLDQVRKGNIFSDFECEGGKCCKTRGYYCFKKNEGIAFPRTLGKIPGAKELINELKELKDQETKLTYDDLVKRAGGQEEMGEAWLQKGDMFRELAEMDREYQGEVNLRKKTIIKRTVILPPSMSKSSNKINSSDEPVSEEVPAEPDKIRVEEPNNELHNNGACVGFPINFEKYVSKSQGVVCLGPCCVMPQLKKRLEEMDVSRALSVPANQIVIYSSGRTTLSQKNSYLDYLGGGETACGPKGLTDDKKKSIGEKRDSLNSAEKDKLKAHNGVNLENLFGTEIASKINKLENYKNCLHTSGTAIDVLWKSIWEENTKNILRTRNLMDKNIPEQNRLRRFLCDQGLINWAGEYWHYDYTGKGWNEGKKRKLCYYGSGNNDKFNFGVPSIKLQTEWGNKDGYKIIESGKLDGNGEWKITQLEKFGEVSKLKCNECGKSKVCTKKICTELSDKVGGSGCEWKAKWIFGTDGTCSLKKIKKVVRSNKETVKLVCVQTSEYYKGGTLKKNKYFNLIEGKIIPNNFDPDDSKKDGDYFKFDEIDSSKVEFDHFIIMKGKLVKKDGIEYRSLEGVLDWIFGKSENFDYRYMGGVEMDVDFNDGAYAKYKFKINCNKENDSCEFKSLVNEIKNIEGYNSDCGFTFEADNLSGDG